MAKIDETSNGYWLEIKAARDAERDARAEFEARKAEEWEHVSHNLRKRTASAVQSGLENGLRRANVMRALGTKDFYTVDKYLSDAPVSKTDYNEGAVIIVEVSDGVRKVIAQNYRLPSGRSVSGEVTYVRDEADPTLWLAEEHSDLSVDVDEELFFSQEENVARRKWEAL